MKNVTTFVGMIVSISCIAVHAQTLVQTVAGSRTIAGGCNWVAAGMKWKDGQTVSLFDVQELIQHVKLPAGWSMFPQSALDTIMNISPVTVKDVVYHCDATKKLAPNQVVSFYFTYQNDTSQVRLPDINVFLAPPSGAPVMVPPQVPNPAPNATPQ